MPKNALSKEEIAKKFDLPERKSKIATLMKQDEVAYCICRSSDSARFMIGCDACEEWYHGDCIGISERAAKDIKRYYCDRCRFEDSTLITRYKSDFKKERRDKSPDEWEPPARERGRSRSPLSRPKKSKTRSQKAVEEKKHHRTRKRKESFSDDDPLEKYPAQQCYGPGCCNGTRPGSKYCSDNCGLKLAATRIYQVLPQRIQEWSLTTSVGEENNKRQLEMTRAKIKEVKALLKELDEKHIELDKIIARGKSFKVEETDGDGEEETGGETTMYCITCGHEIHSRTAVRHMDKCFNKHESQTSFGSIHQTRIQGNNMFCDFYNSSTKTYCKRLKVMCPEHSKDIKPSPMEPCGCPLVANVFYPTGSFCRESKTKCMRHFNWEKIRRAEIDMERVRQWLKLDELMVKEQEIRNDIAGRGGVLGLMLHSTYNHEIMDKLADEQQANDKNNEKNS